MSQEHEPADHVRSRVTADDELTVELRRERRRHFELQRLNGPAGTSIAAITFVSLSDGLLDATARWTWFGGMAVVVALMLASYWGPLARWLHADGLPVSSHVAHVAVGVGWGVTLWLDRSATRDTELVWICAVLLAAVTGGASAGLSGSNRLGRNLVVSMWLVACVGLVTTGHPVAGSALAVFATVMLSEIAVSRAVWEDLVRVRLRSTGEAAASRHAASHDGLTGSLNRTGLRDAFDAIPIDRARSAVYVDLDGFKSVNDRYGHRMGDLALVEVARRLRAVVARAATNGLVARFGGDEFVVIAQCGDGDELRELAAMMRSAIERPFDVSDDGMCSDEPIHMSASIGLASAPDGRVDFDDLIDHSDAEQYRVKRSRPDRDRRGTAPPAPAVVRRLARRSDIAG